MSRMRRFLHLEGRRPARAEPPSSADAPRFAAVHAPPSTIACASCGEPLAHADDACARCTPASAPARADRRAERFRTLAGEGPMPLACEVEPRGPDAEIARTVPPWRGEALPEDVAAEVRQKLGTAPPHRVDDPLAWADRELARERAERNLLLLLLGAGGFGRNLVREAIGLLVAVAAGIALLLYRACA